jgi:hypothetical protein
MRLAAFGRAPDLVPAAAFDSTKGGYVALLFVAATMFWFEPRDDSRATRARQAARERVEATTSSPATPNPARSVADRLRYSSAPTTKAATGGLVVFI